MQAGIRIQQICGMPDVRIGSAGGNGKGISVEKKTDEKRQTKKKKEKSAKRKTGVKPYDI